MTIKKTQSDNQLIITLSGRLDTTSAPQLQAELIPEFNNVKKIVLDFKDLPYVSSAGLRVLLSGQKTAKAKGAVQALINVSPEVMEVFEMTGFSDILTIE